MPSVNRTRLRRSGILKMFAIFSNIGCWNLGVKLYFRVKRRCEGVCPRLPIYSKRCLANKDGLAAGLLDRFLGGLGELVRVDGDSGLDLPIIEDLDETVLLAEEAEGNDLVQGELGDIF